MIMIDGVERRHCHATRCVVSMWLAVLQWAGGAQLPGTSVACPAVEQKRFEALVEQLNSARTCVETGGRDGVREWNEGRERWRKCPAGGRTEWRAAGRELRGEQVAALWINRFGRVFECWRITAIQRTYALRQ